MEMVGKVLGILLFYSLVCFGQCEHLAHSLIFEIAKEFTPEERAVANLWAQESHTVYSAPLLSQKGVNRKSPDAYIERVVPPTRSNPRGFGTVEFKTPNGDVDHTDIVHSVATLISRSFNGSFQSPRIHVDGRPSGIELQEAIKILDEMVKRKDSGDGRFKPLEWIRITGKNRDKTLFEAFHNYITGERWVEPSYTPPLTAFPPYSYW